MDNHSDLYRLLGAGYHLKMQGRHRESVTTLSVELAKSRELLQNAREKLKEFQGVVDAGRRCVVTATYLEILKAALKGRENG